jgi:hypothetical protein
MSKTDVYRVGGALPASAHLRRLFAVAAIVACANNSTLANPGGGSTVNPNSYQNGVAKAELGIAIAIQHLAPLLEGVPGKVVIAIGLGLALDGANGGTAANSVANAITGNTASSAPAANSPAGK